MRSKNIKSYGKFIFVVLSQYYWEKDPAFKEKLKETAFQKLPYYLDKFEAQVKRTADISLVAR